VSWYRINWEVDDADPLQATLNRLYHYQRDTTTKVLHRARLNLFARLLDELPSGGPALDVGCSAGAYSQLLVDHGFRPVVGVDVDASAIESGRREFPQVEFLVAPAETLDERDRYSLVLCTEVLEHAHDPNAIVDMIERALRPDGVAVFSLPNALSLPYARAVAGARLRRRPLDPELQEHLRFPAHRVLSLLNRPGFERVRTTGANLLLTPRLIARAARASWFPRLNAANAAAARLWPLRYFAQFFFVVVRKRADARAGDAASAS
jgi:2-polyprenyl-3-methyl-5-hydroxy-6-metoxy-1,4-benzoquinol methylase